MPKRKLQEVDLEAASDGEEVRSEDSNSSVNTSSSADVPDKEMFTGIREKKRKKVKFDQVTVYYFPRKQGFTCVPSQGGSTLGMAEKHTVMENFSLAEYVRQQRRQHQHMLNEQKLANKATTEMTPVKDGEEAIKSEGEDSLSSGSEDEDFCFLQPVTTRQRRLLLRQAGIKKIDGIEKEECKDIRISREVCGCDCRVYCDPLTCTCSQAGIKCQVDRLSFPCGCSKDGCGNKAGRIEFNPIRVRTHFIHTLMRLELEKKRYETKQTLRKSSSESQSGSEAEDAECNGESDLCSKEAEDLSLYNSNELGSCRDCQNTEVNDVMMREVRMSQMGTAGHYPQLRYGGEDGETEGTTPNPAAHPDALSPHTDTTPKALLFSDSEDEATGPVFSFKGDEGSYSESSECSSVGSIDENQPNLQAYEFPYGPPGGAGRNPLVTTSEQQYRDSNAGGYKLEPISEMLNPIRFTEFAVSHLGGSSCSYPTAYSTQSGTHNDNSAPFTSHLPPTCQSATYQAYTSAITPNPSQKDPKEISCHGNSGGVYDNGYSAAYAANGYTGCMNFGLRCLNNKSPTHSCANGTCFETNQNQQSYECMSHDMGVPNGSITTTNGNDCMTETGNVTNKTCLPHTADGEFRHDCITQNVNLTNGGCLNQAIASTGDKVYFTEEHLNTTVAHGGDPVDNGSHSSHPVTGYDANGNPTEPGCSEESKSLTDLSHSKPTSLSQHGCYHGDIMSLESTVVNASEGSSQSLTPVLESPEKDVSEDALSAVESSMAYDTSHCQSTQDDTTHLTSSESTQNLEEIIKESIVETVSA